VTNEEQLQWERAASRPVAAAAFLALAASIASVALQSSARRDQPENNEGRNDRGELLAIDDNAGELVGAAAAQAVSVVLLGVVIWFLYRVTKHRRPETPVFALYLGLAGPALSAFGAVFYQLNVLDIADRFAQGVTEGRAGERRADDLVDDLDVVGAALGFAGQIALAFALVVINLNALRAGILSRFLGIIGIIVGVLFVLPFFGGPLVVQIFWLGAVGALLLGRWPGGRGPAWDSGQAEPWPTAAQRRGLETAGEPNEPAEALDPEPLPQRRSSRKRRRKRRG
jgi:hypothetical protein